MSGNCCWLLFFSVCTADILVTASSATNGSRALSLIVLQLPMALVEPTRPIQFPMGVSARCCLGLYYRCFGHSILSYQWLSRIITYWFLSYECLSCNQPGPYSIQWEFVHAVFWVCTTSQVRSALVKGNSVILLFQAFAYLVRRNLDRFRSPRITLLFRSGHSAGISAVVLPSPM